MRRPPPGFPRPVSTSLDRAFDSHLHLTDARFEADRSACLARARAAGVAGLVTVASDAEDALQAIELAREEANLWATAGLHPHAASRFEPSVLGSLRELLSRPELVAIGETGLDYHYEHAPPAQQRECFEAHIELAVETGLPLVVHSREADADTEAVIRSVTGSVAGVLHCFTGGETLLEAGLDSGWYVSFSGILTFAPELEALARRVPLDRLLVETDSPYLAPVPRRGQRNEPANLVHTLEKLAAVRGIDLGEVARVTGRNAERFYRVTVGGAAATQSEASS